MRFTVIFLICSISMVLACNNYCNGHGKCTTGDKCECFIGWGGADCSLRSCPYDDAFVDIPLGDINHNKKVDKDDDAVDEWRPKGGIKEDLSDYVTSTRAHRYAECSNAGLCDRNSGECVCFDGYEGSACQRRSCPNVDGKVCSGHGSCLTSTTIIHDNAAASGSAYYGWESEKYMSCLCDSGWEGIDCSMRVCPKGFDPIVLSGVTFNYRIKGKDQLATAVNADNFYLKFTYDGMIYESTVIPKIDTANYPKCNAGKLTNVVDSSTLSQITENIKRSIITNVPYLSQATVSFVCGKEGIGDNGNTDLTNNDAADLLISTSHGDVKIFEDTTKNNLEVYKENDPTATSITTTIKIVTSDNKVITVGNDGKITVDSGGDKTSAYALCSRRGLCQSDTGECKCFDGFSGQACQNQKSIAL